MSEIHLRQPTFTYSACGPFTKNKEIIQKLKETRDSRYIYQNKLNKACFQFNMAYGDFKDLPRGTASDNVLSDKTFNTAKNPKCNGYQQCFVSVIYKCIDKKSSSGAVPLDQTETLAPQDKIAINSEIMSTQQFAEELHEPVIRKYEKWKA